MTSCPPFWCSKTMTTSFPGFSLLLRERTLVTTVHVEMCVNKLFSRGKSSTKFCRLYDAILSGVGRKFFLQNSDRVSCKQRCFRLVTIKLFWRQNRIFVKRICTWKKTCSSFCQQDTEIYLDLQVQNQLFVNLHTPHVQFMKRKIWYKSHVYMKHLPDSSLKIKNYCYGIFTFG